MKSYNEHVQRLKENSKMHWAKVREKMRLRQYYFTMANFKNLLPETIEGQKHEEVYQKLLYMRELSPLDANEYAEKIDECKIRGDVEEIIDRKNEPKIFCVYHTGSYRAIMGYLSMLGYDFSLVIDQNVYENQSQNIHAIVSKVNAEYKVNSDFSLINAEDFDAAMKMVKQIRQGKSLVLYIDGNTGTGGVFRHDEKLEGVDFFGKRLLARQGIAYISFLTNTPIVPVLSYRENMDEKVVSLENVVLEFLPKIDPASSKSRKMYCRQSTQLLYKHLEDLLRKYPLQWEGWLYVHKYFDEEKLNGFEPGLFTQTAPIEREALVFNEWDYGLFTFGDQYFLFNFNSYKTFEIQKTEFDLLKIFWRNPKLKSSQIANIEQSTLLHLVENRILCDNKTSTQIDKI